jgi:Putative polyhydroxyalkanoic acid system protein (PHA_gran_rgn)
MKHRIPHGLSHDLARRVARRALETYRDRFADYEPIGEWVDEDHAMVSFKAAGRRLEGQVRVDTEAIELELEVPLLWRPFQGQAMRLIEEQVQSWLERARNGELASD